MILSTQQPLAPGIWSTAEDYSCFGIDLRISRATRAVFVVLGLLLIGTSIFVVMASAPVPDPTACLVSGIVFLALSIFLPSENNASEVPPPAQTSLPPRPPLQRRRAFSDSDIGEETREESPPIPRRIVVEPPHDRDLRTVQTDQEASRRLQKTFAGAQVEVECAAPFFGEIINPLECDPLMGIGSVEHESGMAHVDKHPLICPNHCINTKISFLFDNTRYKGSLFAIITGHRVAGPKPAYLEVSNLLPKILKEELLKGRPTLSTCLNAFKMTFVRIDQILAETNAYGGATATVVFITGGAVWTANIGLGQAIIAGGDRVVRLARQTSLYEEVFRTSAQKRGARIQNHQGLFLADNIPHARLLGEHELQKKISPRPKVTRCLIDQSDQFLVIASPGFWTKASPLSIHTYLKEHTNKGISALASGLAETAHTAGCVFNIDVIVIKLS